MILQSELSVSFFDFLSGGRFGDTKRVVMIFGHKIIKSEKFGKIKLELVALICDDFAGIGV
jgi:hypothetical protein